MHLRFFLPVVGMCLLSVGGCSRSGARADLVICNLAEPESLDPAIANSQPDLRVVAELFEGLTRVNAETGAAEPGLAERWEKSEDGLSYLFFLRTNLVWSTGEAITAEDVVYSWRRVVDPATASYYAGHLFPVRNAREIHEGEIKDVERLGVGALDGHRLRVELVAPTAFFLDLCAFGTLAVVPRRWIERHGDSWVLARPMPTSGAYQLEWWRIHDQIRLRKNPRYWDAAGVGNEVVDILPVDSPSAALNLYETGDADIILDKSLVPSELLDVLLERPDCHAFDYLGTFFLRFNTTKPPFDDARVRKALALSLNKRRIVERITRGKERVASHFTPSGVAGYEPPAGLDYDPELARRLLGEAGYPGGAGFRVFSYLFNSGKVNQQIGVEMQQMWRKELGIEMELRQTETQVWLAAQRSLDYDICRASWVGDYNDVNTFLEVFIGEGSNNRTGWRNQRYDELIREANRRVDGTKRAELMREAEVILVREELPILPLYFYAGVNLFDGDKIGGVYPNLLDRHPIRAMWKKNP